MIRRLMRRPHSLRGWLLTMAAGDTPVITAASFSVDVTTLVCDRSMRDNRIRSIGLQSDQYPMAA